MPTKHTIAQKKYDELHRRNYGFRLHNELDADIISKLASVPSMQGYIKQLIRQDLNGTVSVPFPESTLDILKEQAEKLSLSVPDLIKVMISEQLIRT